MLSLNYLAMFWSNIGNLDLKICRSKLSFFPLPIAIRAKELEPNIIP